MALPTTGNLSVNDVEAEVGLSGTTSLTECFTASNAGGFNPTYGAKTDTNLLAFRGYQHSCVAGLIPFTIFPTPQTSGNACTGIAGSTTYYHNGGSNPIVNGDTIYTDVSGCTTMPSTGSNWVKVYSGSGSVWYRVQVNSSGVVSGRTTCP